MKKDDEMPQINCRIRQLIDLHANRNVAKFADMIGVSQQTLNRLFNIDTRTRKYPVPTTQILCAITEVLVDVDLRWLLIGKESVKPQQTTASSTALLEIIKDKDARIEKYIRENERLSMRVKQLEGETPATVSTSAKIGQYKGA